MYPLFIKEGKGIKDPIAAMPGCYQFSVDQLSDEIKSIHSLGIPAVILFGIPAHKDAQASSALLEHGVIQQAIKVVKTAAPELLVITDLCFCEYMDHGHCGVVTEKPSAAHTPFAVDNDQTLKLLAQQALSHVRAGADMVAPSGMMDGMVQAIRRALDEEHFHDIPVMSYAAKYASALYGPFREAAEGAPQFGDRSSYQMDPANSDEALREVELDISEGADIIMIKPALSYLDIIYKVKQRFPGVPISAYQVSGEYAMIKAAAERGWVDEKALMLESLISIKRAGADFMITYFAKEAAEILNHT